MNEMASKEDIAAALAYEALHVPALFGQWAPKVVKAAGIRSGDRVLDVACGTGILARQAASQAGDDGYVAGLDASPGMLTVASRLAPSIDWREGMAESLPFESKAFDAVISQFGLMFFQDRTTAVREMLRVMSANGRLAVAVWDSLENSEAYPVEVALLERMAGTQAADALRAPFALGDKKALKELFRDAGAGAIEIVTHHGTARFPSIRAMVEADLRGWLPVMGVQLTEDLIADILEQAGRALDGYVSAEGGVAFDAPAHIVIGRKT